MPETGFLIIFIALLIGLLVIRLNRHKIKGAIGESRVAGQLRRLQSEEYQVINNLLIRNGDRSSQIDHVVVSVYGIFVIETKNYSGWIHGGEHSEYWTQSIYKSKTQFRNPIKQNWAHIYALKEALPDYKKATYHPIVVFAGSAELKNVYSTIPIIYDGQLYWTIKDRSETPILSVGEVKDIVNKLNEINIRDKGAKKEHTRRARYRAYERRWKEQTLTCPRCGAALVARNGQYGHFYGCANYPECRYTQQY